MSEKYKSRKNEPVYSSTYDNGGWPARDSLPTKDPIGDVDDHTKDALRYTISHQAGLRNEEERDEWVEGYKKWQADQKAYEEKMRPHLIRPEGKIAYQSDPKGWMLCDGREIHFVSPFIEPKCTCGTHAVYGNIPAHNHKNYCDLFKAAKNNV